MQSENYGIGTVDATGSRGNVRIILSLVNRTDLPRITAHIHSTNPHVCFSIEDVRYVNGGVFRSKKAQCYHQSVSFIHSTPEEKITSE